MIKTLNKVLPFRKKKKTQNDPLFKSLIRGISVSPESQMSARLRKKCVDLLQGSPSEAKCYDLLDSISKEPCIKVTDKLCLGEISSFIQALCSVSKHYPRPDDASNIGSTNGDKPISDSLSK